VESGKSKIRYEKLKSDFSKNSFRSTLYYGFFDFKNKSVFTLINVRLIMLKLENDKYIAVAS
jgi:hypothetical protein